MGFIKLITKDTTKDAFNTKNYKLNFIYNQKQIGKDSSDYLVYFGYKTVVIGNSKTQKYSLYTTDQISIIEYSSN